MRDLNLLKSALNSPFQTWGSVDLYKTIEDKAAHLCYSVVKNHPMIDGNKRLGAHLLVTFLDINNYQLIYDDNDFYDVVINLASNLITVDDLVKWIKLHRKGAMNFF